MLAIFSLPVGGRANLTLGAAAIASGFVVRYVPHESIYIQLWTPIFNSVVVAVTAWRELLARNELRLLAAEFEARRAVAPPAVVLRSASLDGNVADAFRPANRTCVCICTDWRSYQETTQALPAMRVVECLTDYYDLTSLLLRDAFPAGNYFSDWIADELFVVAFIDGDCTAEQIVRGAVTFSQSLLDAQAAFRAVNGVPRGVDIGIAFGSATVGVMGPSTHPKATALGETPGRARRLQSLAKTLRPTHGSFDRIVIGREVYEAAGSPALFQYVAIDDHLATKDLDDPAVFAWRKAA